VARVIDYLEQRRDVDATKVAYLGLSLGGALTPNILPHESRIRAAILWSGGFGPTEPQDSLDLRMALAHRAAIPILMLGGESDSLAPVDPHQRALFRAFGTPEQDKRMRTFEGAGHWPLPMNELIRESLDFLDHYLGPVATGR
jgi:dienelactone hydrolase